MTAGPENCLNHPTLSQFRFSTPYQDDVFDVNAIGARARRHYMPESWFTYSAVPRRNEDLFEWIDIVDAVATAANRVTVIDFGAGYGRWLVNAAMAARQLGKAFFLVGVEAEPQHHRWMLEHLADNGISGNDFLTINQPISDKKREVVFVTGHPSEWYGQLILDRVDSGYGDWSKAVVEKCQAISATRFLKKFSLVDVLLMDIQGEELRVVPNIMRIASRRVRRIHVGTHSAEIDGALPPIFQRYGWRQRFGFPCNSSNVMTQFGPITFQDGVQSWENQRFDPASRVQSSANRRCAWFRRRSRPPRS